MGIIAFGILLRMSVIWLRVVTELLWSTNSLRTLLLERGPLLPLSLPPPPKEILETSLEVEGAPQGPTFYVAACLEYPSNPFGIYWDEILILMASLVLMQQVGCWLLGMPFLVVNILSWPTVLWLLWNTHNSAIFGGVAP
ncbi:Hypothetical predicted protein [Prunus dulcis]|uniref:Uncharacterized protein n=1 Tax=Prunus dulcis TaxID=3755 RepID=A0A5E4G221_PRUDU|nr:hypothetical protein L3X38_010987 [Prunus dulcis]VVA33662.1 Hypothetical predicted protein [Prunus dulcis]